MHVRQLIIELSLRCRRWEDPGPPVKPGDLLERTAPLQVLEVPGIDF